ncbi:MAG TPA: hypothetical protein VJN88_01385 [Ktedonobacterales bacterium]|nr:hypothetical protein [Ktedonobacterales bacterium]
MSTHSGGYDLMLQFEEDLLNDILARALDDPLTLAAQSPRVVPRQVGFPAPPPNAKTMLWWEQPAFTVASGGADQVTVAMPIHGGAQVGHSIYTVDGVVEVERGARLRRTSAGVPYLALSEPSPWNLRLGHLRVQHGKTPVDPASVLPGIGGNLIGALTVATQALARVPFSYVTEAPRLAFPVEQPSAPERPNASRPVLRLGSGALQTLRTPDVQALALGFTLAGSSATPGPMATALPPRAGHGAKPGWLAALTGGTTPNMALTFSAHGITAAFAQMSDAGPLAGEAVTSGGATARWRWRTLSVAFQPDATLLSGQFELDGAAVSARATLRCRLNQTTGGLIVEPVSVQASDPGAYGQAEIVAIIAESWKSLLLRLLRAAPRQDANRYAPDALTQRLWLPETRITVETQAAALTVLEGEMTLLYAVPQSLRGIARQVLSKIS